MMPLFTIIVASLNAEKTIKLTIDSILGQSFGDFEVIVKDGLSRDGTLAEIPSDARIKVIAAKDVSVYDGMNQAIAHAKGKFLLFLNCGDTFADADVLAKTATFIQEKEIAGDAVLYGDYRKDGKSYRQDPAVDRRHFLKEGLCHQSVFFGRELFLKHGAYDLDFKICADYELMTRFFMNGATYHHLDFVICDYLGGGISEAQENLDVVRRDGNMVRKRYFSRKERFLYCWRKLTKKFFAGRGVTSSEYHQ